jgi:hypothetical protein
MTTTGATAAPTPTMATAMTNDGDDDPGDDGDGFAAGDGDGYDGGWQRRLAMAATAAPTCSMRHAAPNVHLPSGKYGHAARSAIDPVKYVSDVCNL